MKILTIYLIIVIICLSNVQSQENQIKVGYIDNDEIFITFDLSKLKLAFENEWQNIAICDEVNILGNEQYYLVGKGIINDTSSISLAIELFSKVENNFINLYVSSASISHRCTGICCLQCSFEIEGPIIVGCNCNRADWVTCKRWDGYCEHSIFEVTNYYYYLISLQ